VGRGGGCDAYVAGVGPRGLGNAGEVLEQVAPRLGQVLAVVHEVGRHHDLLLHHVVEGYHGAAGVPARAMPILSSQH